MKYRVSLAVGLIIILLIAALPIAIATPPITIPTPPITIPTPPTINIVSASAQTPKHPNSNPCEGEPITFTWFSSGQIYYRVFVHDYGVGQPTWENAVYDSGWQESTVSSYTFPALPQGSYTWRVLVDNDNTHQSNPDLTPAANEYVASQVIYFKVAPCPTPTITTTTTTTTIVSASAQTPKDPNSNPCEGEPTTFTWISSGQMYYRVFVHDNGVGIPYWENAVFDSGWQESTVSSYTFPALPQGSYQWRVLVDDDDNHQLNPSLSVPDGQYVLSNVNHFSVEECHINETTIATTTTTTTTTTNNIIPDFLALNIDDNTVYIGQTVKIIVSSQDNIFNNAEVYLDGELIGYTNDSGELEFIVPPMRGGLLELQVVKGLAKKSIAIMVYNESIGTITHDDKTTTTPIETPAPEILTAIICGLSAIALVRRRIK